MPLLDILVDKCLRGDAASRPEAAATLSTFDDALLDVVAVAAAAARLGTASSGGGQAERGSS